MNQKITDELQALVWYYGSMRKAAKKLKVNVSTISRLLNGKIKKTKYERKINRKFRREDNQHAVMQNKIYLDLLPKRKKEYIEKAVVSTKVVSIRDIVSETSRLLDEVEGRYKESIRRGFKPRVIKD